MIDEDMFEEDKINRFLNMIATQYDGNLATQYGLYYLKKCKEIERLNNIINELENKIKEYINTSVFYEEFEKAEHYRQILIELKELKEKSDKE